MRLATAAGLCVASSCFAADGVGGSLALTSDYVYRGLTQSNGQPALQGDLHYASQRGWLIGVWASTVELNWWDGRTGEVDAYLGYRWSIDRNWSAKLSAVHYEYPWNGSRFRYDYNEIVGSLAFRNNLFLTIAWSPDTSRYSTLGYFARDEAIAYEVATALPLKGALTANLGVGYYDLSQLVHTGYLYWNAGLSYEWRSFRTDVSYVGTDSTAERLFYGDVAGDRFTASVSWRF